MSNPAVNVITLGCSKNTVDSEHLMAQLENNGLRVLFDSNSTETKTVIINTCGFIGDAKEESVNTILGFAAAKTAGTIDRLYVFGCLSQRYPQELTAEIPEVDRFFGVDSTREIVETLGGRYDEKLAQERFLSTPRHYAYLKISEGCNRGCGYCAIPLIRGKHVSVPIEELVAEAELLAKKGVKELIVIAQETTSYGTDLYGKSRLAELLKRLAKIGGIEWIRLHYAYPAGFPDDVIATIREEPKICKYLDIPFQHIADSQLRSMRRGVTRERTYALIEKLRREVPGIALRTTLLTGYSDESEGDFKELLQFVRDVRFERLGVFPYSEEEGTYSALKLKNNIPDAVKHQRAEAIMALQNGISEEINQKRIGGVETVIVDRQEGGQYVGRSQYDSPEVDAEIFITSDKPLNIGGFYEVKITSAGDYDLSGMAL